MATRYSIIVAFVVVAWLSAAARADVKLTRSVETCPFTSLPGPAGLVPIMMLDRAMILSAGVTVRIRQHATYRRSPVTKHKSCWQSAGRPPTYEQIMIEDRIQKIEARLTESANISEPARAELLKLLAALKDEVGTLTKNHEEDARSLAGFVDASAHEATRLEKKPKQVEASLNGLTASVEAFEASHPKLAEVVNQIAVRLSNMGI